LFSYGVHHGAASFEIGNQNLKTEQGYTSTIGIQLNKQKLRFLNECYYNFFNNFIYLNPTLQPIITIRGTFPAFEFTQTKALIAGNDLSAYYDLTQNFTLSEKLSIIYGQNLSNKSPLYFIPSNRLNTALNFKKEMKNLYPLINIESIWVLKQERYLANSDYAPPPPSYHLLNFEIGTKKIWKCNKVAIIFAVQNLLNVSYRDYTNRFRYYTDEAGRNFNIKLNYKF
jgi:iron complex outermembrane receptor protein